MFEASQGNHRSKGDCRNHLDGRQTQNLAGMVFMDVSSGVPLNVSVVLNTHENSPLFQDTLESVRANLTNDVLVVVDAFAWKDFDGRDIPAHVLKGFHHGKPAAPYRNMALGLMQAWQVWSDRADWYCYMEYDCLVAGDVKSDLASLSHHWILGNDHRVSNMRLPFIDNFLKSEPSLNYLLGCCVFFNVKYLRRLAELDFFTRFLHYTNFFTGDPFMVDERGKKHRR